MAGVQLIGYKALNRIIANHPAVQWKLQQVAHEVAAKAEANLAGHTDTGAARIEVGRIKVKYGRIDWFVSLVDDDGGAMAIEFDHLHNISGKPVGGLHILSRAAGLV